jgi:hypothetical protein
MRGEHSSRSAPPSRMQSIRGHALLPGAPRRSNARGCKCHCGVRGVKDPGMFRANRSSRPLINIRSAWLAPRPAGRAAGMHSAGRACKTSPRRRGKSPVAPHRAPSSPWLFRGQEETYFWRKQSHLFSVCKLPRFPPPMAAHWWRPECPGGRASARGHGTLDGRVDPVCQALPSGRETRSIAAIHHGR